MTQQSEVTGVSRKRKGNVWIFTFSNGVYVDMGIGSIHLTCLQR